VFSEVGFFPVVSDDFEASTVGETETGAGLAAVAAISAGLVTDAYSTVTEAVVFVAICYFFASSTFSIFCCTSLTCFITFFTASFFSYI